MCDKETEIRPGVLWLTGLSGSGKSTIAERVCKELQSLGVDYEYLDGDKLRAMFLGVGFTKDARDQHIKRVGFMAGALERHGVFVVASFVSPYEEARREVRSFCSDFIEVYVSTPLEECERRDPKGLYVRARRGEIQNFTGISDPYEPPTDPEITIDTRDHSVDESVKIVMTYLKTR